MTDDEKLRRALADEPEFCGEVRHVLRAEVLRLRAMIHGESALASGDGTDRLLTVLYGESSERTIGKAIGGSNARMLGDAAERIQTLHDALYSLVSYCLTCKRHNTAAWMQGFAARLNAAMETLGTDDSVKWPGSWAQEFQLESGSEGRADGPTDQ